MARVTTRRSIVSRNWLLGLALVLLVLLPVQPVLAAPAPGTWTPTGNLVFPTCSGHTATLLSSGKVLILDNVFSQLYDPASGTWSGPAETNSGHSVQTTTLIPDGRVLLAGAVSSAGGIRSSAELYDPATGRWTNTGAMRVARSNHTATLLPNGKVLTVGGNPGDAVATAELYDPVSGTWSLTGSLHTPRWGHTATLLTNGKVLVAGGTPGNGVLASAELYDPASGTWSLTGSAQVGRFLHLAALLPTGQVIIFGGIGDSSELLSTERYDPVSGTWSPAGNLTDSHEEGSAATTLANGQVLLVAGTSATNHGSILATAELYDPQRNSWRPTGSLHAARFRQTVTLLNNGQVLEAGGFNETCQTSAELYTPPTPTRLPTTCALSASGRDAAGRTYIRVAAHDMAAGLQSLRVTQSANATVALPLFPPGFRDPAVVTATKIVANQPSTLTLSVTNRAGTTVTCDPVLAELVGQGRAGARQVFSRLAQADSKVMLSNGSPGLQRVVLRVNGHRIVLDHLKNGEDRFVDVANAMRPGRTNTIVVTVHGPRDSNATLIISD